MARPEFIQGLAGHIATQHNDSRLAAQENQRKEQVLKNQAPDKWATLKTWMRDAVRELNQNPQLTQAGQNLVFDDRQNQNQFKISQKTLASEETVITVTFSQSGSIICNGKDLQSATFKSVVRDATVIFVEEPEPNSRQVFDEPEKLGEHILRLIFKYTQP
ncbi:MAG TPA: hypothetical protein VKY85_23265 [Candidatus Angelobacter sp.]|nr:hypothetical protein [Candidatus Angelobacter sp.]